MKYTFSYRTAEYVKPLRYEPLFGCRSDAQRIRDWFAGIKGEDLVGPVEEVDAYGRPILKEK